MLETEGHARVLVAQLRREVAEASADNARLRARIASLTGTGPIVRIPAPREPREPWVLAYLRQHGPSTIPEIIAGAIAQHGCRAAPSRATVQVALSKYRDRVQRFERIGERLTVYGLKP